MPKNLGWGFTLASMTPLPQTLRFAQGDIGKTTFGARPPRGEGDCCAPIARGDLFPCFCI